MMKKEAMQTEGGGWSRMVRALCAGVPAGAAVMGLMTVAFAAAIFFGKLPTSAFLPMAQVSAFSGALAGGFFAARRAGGRGAAVGGLTGAVLMAVLTAAALIASGQGPGGVTVTRMIVMPLCGAVGGIIGMNLRRR